jgi:hypothetical protein
VHKSQIHSSLTLSLKVEDPEEELYCGDRGTILVRDALGDLHILWSNGELDVWKVPDAQTYLRVIVDP